MLVPFSPKPGLNSDDTTFSADERWADGNNVRFYNGKPQVIGGFEELFSFTASGAGHVRAILPFLRSGAVSIAYGTAGTGAQPQLFVGSGLAAPTERTPANLSVSSNWSLAPWGDTLLSVPEGGTLYEQTESSTAAAVAAAPDSITHMLVTPQRQVLALGCNEEASGTFNGLCIRGCDLEDYTDWTTSSTNNAFEHILESGGAIVAGRLIGPYVAVWTTTSLYLGQFIGDPSQAYRFDKIDDNCGLVGPNAVVIHNQRAFWVGADLRIRSWAVGELPQMVPCTVSADFASVLTLANIRFIVASANTRFNEIRFDYQSSGALVYPAGNQNNAYVAASLDTGAWFKGAGGRTAIIDSALLASLTSGYANGPTVIASHNSSGVRVELAETGNLEWTGGSSNLAPYIQSADFYLDNSQRRAMARGCLPDLEGQVGDISLTLFVRDRPQLSAATKGPHTLTTSTTRKDFRASGKIMAVKLAGATSGGSYFRLGKLLFDIVPLGER